MSAIRAHTSTDLWGRLLSENAGDQSPQKPCLPSDHIPLAGINSICGAHGVIFVTALGCIAKRDPGALRRPGVKLDPEFATEPDTPASERSIAGDSRH